MKMQRQPATGMGGSDLRCAVALRTLHAASRGQSWPGGWPGALTRTKCSHVLQHRNPVLQTAPHRRCLPTPPTTPPNNLPPPTTPSHQVHTIGELERMLSLDSLEGCMLGINNRDLQTFKVDLANTQEIMASSAGQQVGGEWVGGWVVSKPAGGAAPEPRGRSGRARWACEVRTSCLLSARSHAHVVTPTCVCPPRSRRRR